MEWKKLLPELNGILSELDAAAEDEELEELAAELEDAIFLLECADDAEEADGALEEIAGLAEDILSEAGQREHLRMLARKLTMVANQNR